MCEVKCAVEELAEEEPVRLTVSGAESVDPRPWSEVVKRKRKKYILIIKSAEENEKAVENKDAVLKALEGVQIQDVRITNEGNMVMNFEDESIRNQAVAKLNTVKTKAVGKRTPRIMI